MARTFTGQELVNKVRWRSDRPSDNRITDTMILDFLDSAQTDLRDILVAKYEDYFVDEYEFTMVDGQREYDLPADFYKLLGVDIKRSTDDYQRLYRYNNHERNRNTSDYWVSTDYYAGRYRYRVRGDQIKFTPTPTTTDTIRLVYIPAAPKLDALDDTVDGINGWEELLVMLAVRKIRVREEEATGAVDAEIARLVQRVEGVADARDAGEPESIADYRPRYGW